MKYKHDEHLGWIMEEEIVLHDEAAKVMTVTGWVSRKGRFYGDNEDAARYDGCTHRKCAHCDSNTLKQRIYCDQCKSNKNKEMWLSKERAQWNGTDPLYSKACDQYFFDFDELIDYCLDHNATPESLMLVICEPVYLPQVRNDYFYDEIPEDGDLPKDIAEALDALNEKIRRSKPVSWSPGKFVPADNSVCFDREDK